MRALRALRFEEWLAAMFFVVYVALSQADLVEFRWVSHFSEMGLRVLAVLAVVALGHALWRRRREGLAGAALGRRALGDLAGFVRDWIPWVILISVYENSLLLTAYRTDRLYDLHMFRLDELLFGVHADLWLQPFVTLERTYLVAGFYDALYLYMVGLGGLLYLLGRHLELRRYVVAFLAAGYLGYALYFVFPVVGPHYYFDEVYTVALDGRHSASREAALVHAGAGSPTAVFYDVARRLSAKDSYSGAVPRNCFPSLHTAWGVLILLYAYRSARWGFWLLLGPVALMIFGTVYLRFHYLTDLVGGAMLAWFAHTLTPALVRIGALEAAPEART